MNIIYVHIGVYIDIYTYYFISLSLLFFSLAWLQKGGERRVWKTTLHIQGHSWKTRFLLEDKSGRYFFLSSRRPGRQIWKTNFRDSSPAQNTAGRQKYWSARDFGITGCPIKKWPPRFRSRDPFSGSSPKLPWPYPLPKTQPPTKSLQPKLPHYAPVKRPHRDDVSGVEFEEKHGTPNP